MRPERIKLLDLLEPLNDTLFCQLAAEIENGAIFVYPTETIYGVGGSTELHGIDENIYNAKHRPIDKSMIQLAPNLESFSSENIEIPPAADCLAKMFWPGLLTIVVPTKEHPDNLLAIRVSNHPFLVKLFKYISFPIYSTSANISGKSYNPDPDYIYKTFKTEIDFMIDGGVLPPSEPSTVVKVDAENKATLLREGVLSKVLIKDTLEKADFTLS